MHDTGTVDAARQTVARLTQQIESVQSELRRLNRALAEANVAALRYVTVQAICPACGTWERGMGASSAGVFLREPRCFHCGRRCRGVAEGDAERATPPHRVDKVAPPAVAPPPAPPRAPRPAGPRFCEIDDCKAPHYAKGKCRKHYNRDWYGRGKRGEAS